MSDTYSSKSGRQARGIVVRSPGGLRLLPATHRFNAMEGQLFRNAAGRAGAGASPTAIYDSCLVKWIRYCGRAT